MHSRRLSVCAAALVWVVPLGALLLVDGPWSTPTAAQSRGKSGSAPPASAKKPKNEPFVVVQAGDRFDVMKKSEVNAFKKRMDEQYKGEVKAYNEAKRSAAKAKQPFTAPKPVKLSVKVIRKTFKSESEAKSHAQALQAKKGGASSARGTKAVGFAVVEIDGNAKVVTKAEVAALRKKADADYRQAMKDFSEAKKAAAKNKQRFDGPRPKKQVVKVLGPSFKTESDARAFLQKLRDKKEKKNDKKSAKKGRS